MGNQRAKGSLGLLGALTVCGLLAVGAPAAHAVPALQLDIAGGFYDTATQTVLTSSNTFTLYALLDPTARGVSATETYYVSVALSPATSSPASLGSFSFNGTNVNVTSEMTYGTPPIELGGVATTDPGDLPSHGTYPTYFGEFSFTFSSANTSGIYNVQDDPGGIHAGSGLLYAAFTVDRSLLASPYQLHFDLYNESFRRGDTDVNKFAPFSHDAGTTTRGVPEPSAALLLGIGLVGFGVWQRRRAAQAI
jgi:PEP-CTERM motif